MKSAITLLFAATTVTLAVVCLVQSRKSVTQETQITALRTELEASSIQNEDALKAQQRADREREELAAQTEELAARIRAGQLAAATPSAPVPAPVEEPPSPKRSGTDAEKGGFGKMISQMMRDPEARKFIRDQQRMTMDQLYAPLIRQMGLSPEEAGQFKDLLADNMMKAADKAYAVMGGAASSNRTEMLSSLNAEQKAFENSVKDFLGDDRYALYKDYQETIGERTMLNQFKTQLGSDYNLTDPQTEAMLTFMKEEKKSVAATTGLPLGDFGEDKAKLQAMLSGDKLSQYLDAQQTVNQRVYDRARTILSAEQLQTLAKFQSHQAQMMRMGMTMAKKMFTPENSAAGASAQ
ncbi:MAG TPA: hypothetical protein P5205_07015 [Candidatus Paceibacterota bacterium]|nr:hypothetical protein [Verrucomicrobiota bacterium]HSA10108.1 hypothetical protein [Candidatus Paceibacterota bacterium]